MKKKEPSVKIVYLSSYPPRECGIATFAKDLVEAVDAVEPDAKSRVIALNQGEEIYDYERRVRIQIDSNNLGAYTETADLLNNSVVDVINIQHEFGIYGGPSGTYLLALLERLNKPVITTLHTVLPQPNDEQCQVIRKISEYSRYMVVMANIAIPILKEKYGVPEAKIRVIPHGVPDMKPVSEEVLEKFVGGYTDRTILSTFGLLSEGKGIEYAISALPAIVEQHPNVVYFVIGETHPEVRKRHGEEYRMRLMNMVSDLKMEDHVKFHNRYLTLREVLHYLQATDVYITPYLNPNQITSGTLAYALSCGKAVVSTPYLYAQELLSQGRGMLVSFKDPQSIADAVNKILDEPKLRTDMEKKARIFTRSMTWPNVGKAYIKLFKEVIK